MVGHEERVDVVDAVAGQATHTEHGGLGLVVVTHAREVALAPAVDLGWPDHGVATATPDTLEHALEVQRTGILGHVVATRPQRNRLFDQVGFAVGHQQVRTVAELGQARAQARDNPQARGDQFTVAAPGFAGGDDHQFSEGKLTGSRHFRPPQNTGRAREPMRSAPPFLSW